MKRFLACILALSMLLILPSCGRRRELDYISGDMTKWFDLSLSEVSGGTYEIDLPKEITDEDVYKELRWLQLYYATRGNTNTGDIYLTCPEFADVVFFYYDVALTPDGDSVVSNLFSEDGATNITVGLWEFPQGKIEQENALFDSKIFSDALTQTQPSGRVKEGVVEEGDVVMLSYSVFDEENVQKDSFSNVRINTNSDSFHVYEDIHPKAILSDLIGKTLGEEYTVTDTFVPENGGEAVTYTYRYKVSYKALETFKTVEISLAADAFGEDHTEAWRSLNGKTVYLRYVVPRFVDYDPPALDASFYINTLGLKTEETDANKLTELAHAAIKDKLAQQRLAEEVYPLVRKAIYDRVFARDDRVKKLPKKQVEQLQEKFLATVKAEYETGKSELNFPYADINDFAAAYYNYSLEEYPTAEEVCLAAAEEVVTFRLLTFTIAQLAGIRYTPEKCEEYYAVYLQYQIQGYTKPTYGVTLTDEERAQIHLDAGENKVDQLFEELVQLLIKHYAVFEQVTLTPEEMREILGGKENFLFDGLLEITEMNVLEYLYENNTWNDTTP